MSRPAITMDERAQDSYEFQRIDEVISTASSKHSRVYSTPSSNAQPEEESSPEEMRIWSGSSIFTYRPTSSVISSTRAVYQSSNSSTSLQSAADSKKDHICACSKCGELLHESATQSGSVVQTSIDEPDTKRADVSHKNIETSLWKRFSNMSFESSKSASKKNVRVSSPHDSNAATSDRDAFMKHLVHNHCNLSAPTTPQSAAKQFAEASVPTLHITGPDGTTATPSIAPSTIKTGRSGKKAITPQMMQNIEKGNKKRVKNGDLRKFDEGSKMSKRSTRPVANPLRWQE
jgi:hypothetical protein